jgi:hypothetical protein
VTSAQYAPLADTRIDGPRAPFDQIALANPGTLNVTSSPSQSVSDPLAVIVARGALRTVIVTLALPRHPFESSTSSV